MWTMSESDAANQFGVEESTLARLRKEHKLPHVRIGKKIIRYSDENLSQIVKRFSVPATKVTAKRKAK